MQRNKEAALKRRQVHARTEGKREGGREGGREADMEGRREGERERGREEGAPRAHGSHSGHFRFIQNRNRSGLKTILRTADCSRAGTRNVLNRQTWIEEEEEEEAEEESLFRADAVNEEEEEMTRGRTRNVYCLFKAHAMNAAGRGPSRQTRGRCR